MQFGQRGSFFYLEVRSPRPEDFGFLGMLVRFLINVAALWVAQALVRGFDIDSAGALVVGALIFGVLNALLKPVVSLLSCPLTCATLGLFALVINALMLALTAWVAGWFDLAFHVDGFVAAFLGALVISVVSVALGGWVESNILRPSRRIL